MKLTPLGLSFLVLAAPACLDERIPLDHAADRDGAALEHDPDASVPAAEAHLIVVPSVVDFGSVSLGTESVRSVVLLSAGTAPLVIDHMEVSGHPGFSVELELPLTLAPAASHTVTVRYDATVAGAAAGLLTLHTNDPEVPDGHAVELRANLSGACVSTAPALIEFANVLVGDTAVRMLTITSCGDRELVVDALAITGPGAAAFAVVAPPPLPLVLPPSGSAAFEVAYTPSSESSDEAVLVIGTNERTVEVPLAGISGAAPVAAIHVAEGAEVAPGTTLHLSGPEDASIVKWQWTVDQPVGASAVLQPSSSHANPTSTLWVVGRYVIRLQVWDQYGQSSTLAMYEVFVTRAEALTIELTWHTPGDPDEHDDGPVAGADLDLHLLHPLAGEDGWFDATFDAYWFNAAPAWGVVQVATDDPALYVDDTDGAGPEGIGLVEPESGACYRVGVHAWDDHGHGASKATVRIYEFGNLVFEASEALEMLDLWEVTTVCWPPVEGVPPRLTRVCEGTTTPCEDAGDCADGAACTTHVTPDFTSDILPQ